MAEIAPTVIQEMKAGSEDAFVEMLRTYQGRVRAFLGGFLREADTIDDLAQEIFIEAFKGLADYRPDKPFSSWLFAIGRNLALNHLRKEKNRRNREQDWSRQVDQMSQDLCEGATAEGFAAGLRALTECLNALPALSRSMIQRFYFDRLSGEEMAERFKMTANAVRQRLSRIRDALRDCVMSKTGETER